MALLEFSCNAYCASALTLGSFLQNSKLGIVMPCNAGFAHLLVLTKSSSWWDKKGTHLALLQNWHWKWHCLIVNYAEIFEEETRFDQQKRSSNLVCDLVINAAIYIIDAS